VALALTVMVPETVAPADGAVMVTVGLLLVPGLDWDVMAAQPVSVSLSPIIAKHNRNSSLPSTNWAFEHWGSMGFVDCCRKRSSSSI